MRKCQYLKTGVARLCSRRRCCHDIHSERCPSTGLTERSSLCTAWLTSFLYFLTLEFITCSDKNHQFLEFKPHFLPFFPLNEADFKAEVSDATSDTPLHLPPAPPPLPPLPPAPPPLPPAPVLAAEALCSPSSLPSQMGNLEICVMMRVKR